MKNAAAPHAPTKVQGTDRDSLAGVLRDKRESGGERPAAGPVAVHFEFSTTDPEVIEAFDGLSKAEADGLARRALKLGVTVMNTTRTSLDKQALQDTHALLMQRMSEFLTEKQTSLTASMSEAFTRYFDPLTGLVPQRLNKLVNHDDGELALLLSKTFGDDEGMARRLLEQFMGKNSELIRKLDPDNKNSLQAELQTTMGEAVQALHTQVAGEFSLDNEESALNRFLAKLGEQSGDLQDAVSGNIDALMKQFSLDDEASAISVMMRRMNDASAGIESLFSLDDENSVLARMHRHNQANHEKLQEQITQLVDLVARGEARTQAEREGTAHGHTFEEAVSQKLAAWASGFADLFEDCGSTTGRIRSSKVGDHLVCLGSEHVASGRRIVFESKENKSYSAVKAKSEIEVARHNRDADVGVFVLSKRSAGGGAEPLRRDGQDIFVVWDAEDASSDAYLRAAYVLARHMVVAQQSDGVDVEVDLETIDKTILDVQKQCAKAQGIRTKGQSIQKAAETIIKDAEKLESDLARNVERLQDEMKVVREVVSARA